MARPRIYFVDSAGFADGVKYGTNFIPSNLAKCHLTGKGVTAEERVCMVGN